MCTGTDTGQSPLLASIALEQSNERQIDITLYFETEHVTG